MDHRLITTKSSMILLLTLSSQLLVEGLLGDLTQFCEKTTNPVLCVQTMKPVFNDGHVKDPMKALDIEVDATMVEAKKTLVDIKALAAKGDKDLFGICMQQYTNMLDAIKETKEAIAKKDIITAKFKFSAVISYQSACKDSFEGEKIPFIEDSEAVYNLGGNCLDIIADIEKALGPPILPPNQPTVPSPFSDTIGTVS